MSVPVIYVNSCDTERYDVPTVIAHKMQLESVTPSHCIPTVFCHADEHFVEVPPDIVAYGNHGAVKHML